MKKFRNTQYTYDKLLEEIEFLKKQTIVFNSEYNKSKDMHNESKAELEALRIQINNEFHENKVNISNHNKDFIENLNNKKKQLETLEYTLSQKEIDIKCNNDRLENLQIELQKVEKKLASKETELNKKEKSISRQNKKLDKRLLEMCQKEDQFTKDIKGMNKELSVLNKSLIDLRGESVRIKQEQDEKLEKIGQQKKVLQIWEDRLIEKEEKIASDMRTLLSAKNYKNV